MRSKPKIEVLVVPIWPGLKALGFRTRSAAYGAVKRGIIPPEAIVEVGQMKRISKRWIDRKTSGDAA